MFTTVTWKAQAVNIILSRGNIYHIPIKSPLTSIRFVSFNKIRLITDLSSCNGNNPGLTSHMWAPMNDRHQISSCPLTSCPPNFSQTPYLPLPPHHLPQYHSPELYLWLPQCPIKTSRRNPTINNSDSSATVKGRQLMAFFLTPPKSPYLSVWSLWHQIVNGHIIIWWFWKRNKMVIILNSHYWGTELTELL